MDIEECYLGNASLLTPVANHPAELLGALHNNRLAAKPNPHMVLTPQRPGVPASPVIVAGVLDNQITDLNARLLILLHRGLAPILRDIDTQSQTLIQINLASVFSDRINYIDADWLQATLAEQTAELTNCHWQLIPINQSATENLQTAITKLSEFDQVIYGGVDSLVNPQTVMEYGERLQTEQQPDGIVLAEAAGFIALTNKPTQYQLTKLACYEEPYHNQANLKPTQALTNAIMDCTKNKVDAIIPARNGEPEAEIEWYQTIGALNKKNIEPLDINIQPSLGLLGAAELPVLLALAKARCDYPFPKINSITITERSEATQRAVILLEKQKSEN